MREIHTVDNSSAVLYETAKVCADTYVYWFMQHR